MANKTQEKGGIPLEYEDLGDSLNGFAPVVATKPSASAGTTTVQGTKTNNAAAPGANNVGALPAIATAAAPNYIEGDQVGLSTDLSGFLRGNHLNGVASGFSNTDTVLLANATFTPSGGANNGYDDLYALGLPSLLTVSVNTDQGGAIFVQWSRDGTNVDLTDRSNVSTSTPMGTIANVFPGGLPTGLQKTFPFTMRDFRFCRVTYTNGATLQGSFHLRSTYHYNPSAHALLHRYAPAFGSWEAVPTNSSYNPIAQQTNKTGTTPSGLQTNLGWAGVILSLIITAVPGAPAGLDLALFIADSSGNQTRINKSLGAGAFLTATGTFRWVWHPAASQMSAGIDPAAIKQLMGITFPVLWAVSVVPQDGQAYSYRVQADSTIF